jgi:4-amino-4-deoxy-L-arabinose transferase-like glycosyltransferase
MEKPPGPPKNRSQHKVGAFLTVLALLLIILLTVVVRVGLIDVPLERDEGEYAYAGQLILQGIPPYQQMYNMKLPGIYAAYASMMAVLGQTHQAIHLGLLAINAATILLVFLLAKRLYDPIVGIVAAAFFAVMSLLPSVQGIFANAEHFVILSALGGLFFLLKALEEKQQVMLFLSGLLLGLSFLMKQHGAAFILFGGIYILYDLYYGWPWNWRTVISRIGLFTMGAAVPYGLTCLFFTYSGSFDKFWFWTFDYARTYTNQVPILVGWSFFKYHSFKIITSAPLIWLLVFIGLIASWRGQQSGPKSVFAVTLMAFSFLATVPGFFFRPHYFILLLPASAILAGVSVGVFQKRLLKSRSMTIKYGCPLLLVAISVFAPIYQHRNLLFEMTPHQIARTIYGLNPFPEALEISRFVAASTKEGDRIAVLG